MWFRQWPENEPYFEFISDAVDHGQRVQRDGREFRLRPGQIMQHHSGRLRGGVEFCAAANGFFQGLAADGAKRALTRVAREQYDSSMGSPLYGSRTILFAHDELVVEMPEAIAHEAAERLSVVMVESMREFVPDVIVEAPPALMRRWYKSAEPVYKDGRLVPWEPK
jgi:DNA polymerase I-like protein with 3'-5' exonuclease and polymerase domains